MYEFLLLVHFMGVMGAGISIFMALLSQRAAKLSAEDNAQLMATAGPVAAKLSGAAIILLWLSGIGLALLSDGIADAGGWWFRLKIVLVIALTVAVGLVHRQQAKVRRGAAEPASIEKFARPALPLTLLVVTAAVLAFG